MEKKAKKAGLTVAAMIFATLLSKILGMVRQVMIAGIFADSMEGIAFAAASKIPFAIFDMLFSAAVLGSFIPIYKGNLVRDAKRARQFSSAFLTGIAAVTAGIAALGMIFSRQILYLSAPNLDDATAALAAELLRIMFPAMIFAGIAYTLVGILQSHESFILPSLVSAFSNLVIIGYLLLFQKLSEEASARGLAVAYLISWGVQFLTLAVPLFKQRRLPRLRADFKNPDLRLSVKRSLPVMLGSWLLPVGTLTATFFSSYVKMQTSGAAIVVFDYAFSVYSIIAGILTYGICNFIFPKLAEKSAAGDTAGFTGSVRISLFAALVMILPAAAATFILSGEGIRLLYLRGDFTEELAEAVATSLRMLSCAMPAYCTIEILSRAFYSCGKEKYPMHAAAGGILAGILISALLLVQDSLTVTTVALANAAGQITAALLLLLFCRKTIPDLIRKEEIKKAAGTVFSFVVSAAAMTVCRHFLSQRIVNFTVLRNFIIIAIVFLIGIVVYLVCMILTKTIGISAWERKRGDGDRGRRR